MPTSKAPVSPPNRPKRPKRHHAQRQAILDAACRCFIDKGFGGTQWQDIADAVGTSRTALYHYFPSKEAVLEALTEAVTAEAGRQARQVSRRDDLPPAQALRELVLRHARLILTHPLSFRVVERSEANLPEPQRRRAQKARRTVLEHFVAIIRRGVDTGDFRSADPKVAAFAVIGMCNWCAWWFDPEAGLDADAVAEGLADMALASLAPPALAGASVRAIAAGRPAGSVGEALAQARQALLALERLTAG